MKVLVHSVLILVLSSCLKLDSNLYNKKTLTEYQLDNYAGEQDFILDSSYKLPASLIHQLTLPSQSGSEKEPTAIRAIYIGDPLKITSDTVILYCHGNKWHMDFYWQRAKLLANTNGKNKYGVMLMDYRGYGLSEGEPTEAGMDADVDACMKWLKEKGLTNNRLIIYGFSLGSAPSTALCANARSLRPEKLILEAPFGSADIMMQDASRLNMPASYIGNVEIDNAEEIKLVNQPFLWIHGDNDNFLNFKTHGEVVYNNYSGVYSEKYMVEGADHGEVPEKMGFKKYSETIGKFIRKTN